MKLQTGVELTIILAAGLSILLIIITINQGTISSVDWHIRSGRARALVDDIANAAELVYSQGEGAKTRVFVSVPNDVQNISMSNNLIELTFRNGEKVYRALPFNITGELPVAEGNLWVVIESRESESIVYTEHEGYCGNSVIEGGEECDGPALGGETCQSQGFDTGTLSCLSNCILDTSDCSIIPPSVSIALHNPASDTDFTNGRFNSFTVNVSCPGKDCNDVNVSLYTEESGLIATTLGGIPFYTNKTTNPFTINLNAGGSELLTFWVNATGTVGSAYEFFATANLTSNMSINDATGRVTVTITHDTGQCLGVYLTNGTDTSSHVFADGTFEHTRINDNCLVVLNDSEGGYYYSEIFDMGSAKSWKNISWEGSIGEFPDNQGSSEGLNMTGNVLLLHLDELGPDQAPAGSDALDSSGNGYHGNASGGVTYGVSGKYETAFEFDGVNGEVKIPNLMTDDFTAEFWMKTSVSGSTGYTCYHGDGLLWSDWGGTVENDVGIAFLNNRICFWSGNPDNSMLGNSTLNDGQWHHVVARRDRDGGVKEIFVDGLLENNGSTNTNTLNKNPITEIGGNTYDNNFFNGIIDEVAIFNRTLSYSEILDHYRRGPMRLNLSVRSCRTSDCSDADFTDIGDASPQDLNIYDNRYFQFRFEFDSYNQSYTPELYNVTAYYGFPVPPVINSISDSPDPVSGGQNVTITANVTDDAAVDSVWVEIKGTNYTMSPQAVASAVTKWTEDFSSGSDWATWASEGSGIAYVHSSSNCINDDNDDCLNADGGNHNLDKQSDIDLSDCKVGSAWFYIGHIKEEGNLESDDCMEVHFSGNSGGSWSGDINIFCDDNPAPTKNITIPNEYLTANFRIRIEEEGFSGNGEDAWLDGFKVGCIATQTSTDTWTLKHPTSGESGLTYYTVYANDTAANSAVPRSGNYTVT